jgi:hypothetical protein
MKGGAQVEYIDKSIIEVIKENIIEYYHNEKIYNENINITNIIDENKLNVEKYNLNKIVFFFTFIIE